MIDIQNKTKQNKSYQQCECVLISSAKISESSNALQDALNHL